MLWKHYFLLLFICLYDIKLLFKLWKEKKKSEVTDCVHAYLIVATLHEALLYGEGVANVNIVLDLIRGQQLQLSVELSDTVLRQQEEEVQS